MPINSNFEPSSSSQKPVRSAWFNRLRAGLSNTRARLAQALGFAKIDEALYDRLEEALLLSDAGTLATQYLLDALRRHVKQTGETSSQAAVAFLSQALQDLLSPLEKPLALQNMAPTVILMVGVNGAGKTTSIGKLAQRLTAQGKKVLLAPGDTFRAGATEQLAVWARRTGVGLVNLPPAGASGKVDPGAVAFNAIQQGVGEGYDVVLIDTAGRLSTQGHLMQEMQRIQRVIAKALPGAPHHTLLVVDGHTGQNALAQVKAFHEALQLTGLILTKLDGTAKGGALVALAMEKAAPAAAKSVSTGQPTGAAASVAAPAAWPPPVYFLGLGEKAEDLQPFHAADFAHALISLEGTPGLKTS
jgi:fused signal recognition particle receptor